MAEFKIKDKETGKIFTVREKDTTEPVSESKATIPPEQVKSAFGSLVEDYANQSSLVPDTLTKIGNKIKKSAPKTLQPGLETAEQLIKSQIFQPVAGFGSQLMVEKPITAGTAVGIGLVPGATVAGMTTRLIAGSILRKSNGQKFLGDLINKAREEQTITGINPIINLGSRKAREFLGNQTPETLTKGIEIATEIGGSIAFETVNETLKTLKPLQDSISNTVNKYYFKAVKPSSANIKSSGGIQKLKNKTTAAVETIIDNIDNLRFVDDSGQMVNRLPQSLDDFSSAITQTKKQVFNQYDTLVKQTDSIGVNINLTDIADDLLEAASSKSVSLTSPATEKYAINMAERLEKTKTLSLADTQDVIESLNQKLKAFYRNPSADDASKTVFDAMLANRLRKKLNTAVEATTNKNFAGLKSQYGALDEVEKSVAKAAFKSGTQESAGLVDLTNIFTVGDVASGIMSLRPDRIIRGGVGLALKQLYKRMNNPNLLVKKMFSKSMQIKNYPKTETLRQLLLAGNKF